MLETRGIWEEVVPAGQGQLHSSIVINPLLCFHLSSDAAVYKGKNPTEISFSKEGNIMRSVTKPIC